MAEPMDVDPRMEDEPMDVDPHPLDIVSIFVQNQIDTHSKFNPDELNNNCAFVTMGYLLNKNAKALMRDLGINPSDSRKGYTIPEIIESLKRLGHPVHGYEYTTKKSSGGGGPDRPTPGVTEPKFSRYAVKYKKNKLGVTYKRKDGSGHVVVLREPGKPYRSYLDFQFNSNGTNVTKDVEASRIYMAFCFD